MDTLDQEQELAQEVPAIPEETPATTEEVKAETDA